MGFLLPILLFLYSPPGNVKAYDTPDDGGGSITVTWNLPPEDSIVIRYDIYRYVAGVDSGKLAGSVLKGINTFQDVGVKDGTEYSYRVAAVYPDTTLFSELSAPAVSRAQWFNGKTKAALFILLFYGVVLFWFTEEAKKGRRTYIRKIAGLEAVEEAVGRSTELGKPILFVPGIGMISDITTIAALSILKRVAKKAAEYESRVIVPNFDPIVMVAAQETVKEGYTEAGRPDLYNEKDIFFLTSDQFGYAAGVDGMMMREKPGAIFLQGTFYAEALILAETGHSVGAIQISGTTSVTQLPFFIAATDYTLIGEEMYAASAYLSKDPLMLGTIKGEDLMKLIFIVIIIAGVILETFGIHLISNWFSIF